MKLPIKHALCMLSSLLVLNAVPVTAAVQTDCPPEKGFGMNLFRLVTTDKTENVVISPFSVSNALMMAYNGAGGTTKAEMAKVLGVTGTPEEANAKNAEIRISLLKVNPKSALNIANALFAKKEVPFNEGFVQTNEKYYGAKLETLDFKSPDAPKKINGWVATQTKNKIPTIVDQIPADAILYLINAVYFNGTWMVPFEKSQTEKADFNLANGTKKPAMMMHRFGKMAYRRGSNYQTVALPYTDGRLQMVVVLPDKGVEVEQFILNGSEAEWFKSGSRKEGHLALPRFKLAYSTELSSPLKAMGMPSAFNDATADFKPMTPAENVVISRVLHKTFIDVNEEGTEAAAVTAVEMSTTSMPMNPETPFEMVCDRPFFIAIRDAETDSTLFLGYIADPRKSP